jgi:maltose alpha-D-glucosyltransferase/alpha-amylase
MGDNIWLGDRNGVRTPMQWEPGPGAGFSESSPGSLYSPVIDDETHGSDRVNVAAQREDPHSLLHIIRQMIAVKKQHRAFGWGDFAWVELENKAIAAFERHDQGETILAIHNLSDDAQTIHIPIKKSGTAVTDLLTQQAFTPVRDHLPLELMPYQYLWLR